MSELISSGASQSAITDFTVTAGTPKTLYIHFTSSGQGVEYRIFKKSSASAYQQLFSLTPQNITEMGTICGAGTFGAMRVAGQYASSLEVE